MQHDAKLFQVFNTSADIVINTLVEISIDKNIFMDGCAVIVVNRRCGVRLSAKLSAVLFPRRRNCKKTR